MLLDDLDPTERYYRFADHPVRARPAPRTMEAGELSSRLQRAAKRAQLKRERYLDDLEQRIRRQPGGEAFLERVAKISRV